MGHFWDSKITVIISNKIRNVIVSVTSTALLVVWYALLVLIAT